MPKAREIGIGFESPSAKEYVAAAKLVEELGFGTFWVPEDPVFPGAFATASAIASNTHKIKIGIGVLNPWMRHPVQTAMEFAALAEISEGRAILGLGASVKLWIEDQLGIPYVRPVIALREAVEIIKGVCGGEQINHEGQIFKARGVRASFPARRILIHLGAISPRALKLAGELADGVLLNCVANPSAILAAFDRVRLGAERHSRKLDNFSLGNFLPAAIMSEQREAFDALKPYLAILIGLFAKQPQIPFLTNAGVTADAAAHFAERLMTGKPAADMVTDNMVDALSVAGTPEKCRESLERMIDAGITAPVLFFPSPIDFAEAASLVSRHLLPHLL
jgi:5,10-methylenetetrahydromethanopterin reductase